MFEKFTERARKVMSLSRQEAQAMGNDYIGPEHMLLGILQEGAGCAAKALRMLEIDIKRIRRDIELCAKESGGSPLLGQIPFSQRSKAAIEAAETISIQMGADVIGTEHILLGLLQDKQWMVCQIFGNMKIDPLHVRDKVLEVIGVETALDPEGKIVLPDAAELRGMMGEVSRLVEEIDTRISNLAKDYGVYSDPLATGSLIFRVTKMGERWGIECQRVTAQPERITGCRLEEKLEFLAKAERFESLYKAKIVAVHRRAKTVIEEHGKEPS